MTDQADSRLQQLEAENAHLKKRLDRVVQETAALESSIAAIMKRNNAEAEAKVLQMANFAHEFRNPLNVIVGYSELLKGMVQREEGLPRKWLDYSGAIHDAAQLLLGVANGIIEKASLESSESPLDIQLIDAAEVIDGMIRMLSREAEKKKITLLGKYNPNFPKLLTDRSKLQQILMNLMSNAIKFTSKGGKVTVKTAISDDGEHVILVVSDNGPGMTPDEMAKAMAPWGRVDSVMDQQQGAGLGLPITIHLVERLGWQFDLKSNKGRGTTATVLIPLDCLDKKPAIKSWSGD
jgi:two-component system cell cycle sensor histidine kinase PleC